MKKFLFAPALLLVAVAYGQDEKPVGRVALPIQTKHAPPKPAEPPAPPPMEDKALTPQQEYARSEAENVAMRAFIAMQPYQQALDVANKRLADLKQQIQKDCGGTLANRPNPADPNGVIVVCVVPKK